MSHFSIYRTYRFLSTLRISWTRFDLGFFSRHHRSPSRRRRRSTPFGSNRNSAFRRPISWSLYGPIGALGRPPRAAYLCRRGRRRRAQEHDRHGWFQHRLVLAIWICCGQPLCGICMASTQLAMVDFSFSQRFLCKFKSVIVPKSISPKL